MVTISWRAQKQFNIYNIIYCILYRFYARFSRFDLNVGLLTNDKVNACTMYIFEMNLKST